MAKKILNTHTTNSIDAIINYDTIPAERDKQNKPVVDASGVGKVKNHCKDVRLVIDMYGPDGRMESPNVVTLSVYFLRDLLKAIDETEAEVLPDRQIDDLPF